VRCRGEGVEGRIAVSIDLVGSFAAPPSTRMARCRAPRTARAPGPPPFLTPLPKRQCQGGWGKGLSVGPWSRGPPSAVRCPPCANAGPPVRSCTLRSVAVTNLHAPGAIPDLLQRRPALPWRRNWPRQMTGRRPKSNSAHHSGAVKQCCPIPATGARWPARLARFLEGQAGVAALTAQSVIGSDVEQLIGRPDSTETLATSLKALAAAS
jgi:hypothetical protein